ncbi:MAG: hypothetical protein U0168_01200 [Nannocystaceae bacterium]
MAKTLWQLPVPSTALLDGGPTFEKRPRREVGLRMSYEHDDRVDVVGLLFEGVEAIKITFDRARSDSMLEAYDRLMDQGQTSWLDEVVENLSRHGADSTGLAHLIVNFDDGPCYEVICRSYRLESATK